MKNYKPTRYWILFIILFFCFLFFGCASAGIPPKGNQQDTLVVIPFLMIPTSLDHYQLSVMYKLNIENVDTGQTHVINIGTDDGYYIFAKNIPPGNYHIRDYENSTGFRGEHVYSLECNKYLIVKEGKFTICPYKFTVALMKDNSFGYTNYYFSDVVEIKPPQMKLIQEYLSRFENYSKWDL